MKTVEAEQLSLKYLEPEEISIAASLLFQAYQNDELLKQVLSAESDDEFAKKLRALIREELQTFSQSGQAMLGAFIDEQLVGVACAIATNGPLSAQRFWHWRLKLMLSAGYVQTKQLVAKEQAIRAALEQYGECFYLSLIAIHPNAQGQGLGHYLLNGVEQLHLAQEEITGVAVFITQTAQKAFFLKHQYEVIEQMTFGEVSGELMYKKLDTDGSEN